MERLFLVYAIGVLIASVYALPQDDSSKVGSTDAEPALDESAGDEPISDDSEAINDKSAIGESDFFGDETANQDPGLERKASKEPSYPSQQPSQPWGQQPSQPWGQQPSQPWGQQPSQPWGEKPSQPWGEKPSQPWGEKPSQPWGEKPSQPWKPPTSPGLECTTYTEAGNSQREEAVKICQEKGPGNVECVRKFCSAANGPTLNCNSNCLKCPPGSGSQQYN